MGRPDPALSWFFHLGIDDENAFRERLEGFFIGPVRFVIIKRIDPQRSQAWSLS
jgi:hypothetical protein